MSRTTYPTNRANEVHHFFLTGKRQEAGSYTNLDNVTCVCVCVLVCVCEKEREREREREINKWFDRKKTKDSDKTKINMKKI